MKYVRPGEPIRNSAAERNEIAESVNFVRDVLRNSQSGILDPTTELPCIVDVSNSTGTNFERHEAVYVSSPIITPTDSANDFARYRRYTILSPTGWDHLGRLAILLEPIPTGRIGKAVVSGTVQTKVNVIEEWHEYADIEEVSGGRTLQSNPDGSSTCQILWKEAGTGEKWATVRLSNAGQFHLVGKPTGYGISAASDYGGVRTPGTGTIQVYYLDPSTEDLTALEDINGDPCYLTVYNLGTSTIATTEWVLPHCDRWGVWWVHRTAQTWMSFNFVTAVTGSSSDYAAVYDNDGPTHPDMEVSGGALVFSVGGWYPFILWSDFWYDISYLPRTGRDSVMGGLYLSGGTYSFTSAPWAGVDWFNDAAHYPLGTWSAYHKEGSAFGLLNASAGDKPAIRIQRTHTGGTLNVDAWMMIGPRM